MSQQLTRLVTILALIVTTAILCLPKKAGKQKSFTPAIPKTWDTEAMKSLEVPLATRIASPKHITSDYYYRMPVRPIYRSYPIYHPDHEPPGYFNSLTQKEPEIVFDSSKLNSEEDWIRAGELVFDAPVEFDAGGTLFSELRGRNWYDKNKVPLTKEGVFPFMRYVIREKGKVEVGTLSCAMCHSRVMPDGSVIKGAQGNFPDDRTAGYEVKLEAASAKETNEVLTALRRYMRRNYAAPWLPDDPNARTERMSIEEISNAMQAITPGSCARQGSSIFFPTRIPDLIGVKDRRYLDSSGQFQQRDIADFMRYVALNQGADLLSEYADFRPKGELPDPLKENRYSDEQLYALGLFIYSLKPPPNPNEFNDLAARGQQVFKEAGCAGCHTPPLYTNNMLTPVDGFKVPAEDRELFDILPISVGTDPTLAMQTRRGTGYYKVPSLKGVWYRGPFEHDGSVATLEDWLNPDRLKSSYIPTGFRGYAVTSRPVKGHLFGLDLSPEDRNALIAFLKTL